MPNEPGTNANVCYPRVIQVENQFPHGYMGLSHLEPSKAPLDMELFTYFGSIKGCAMSYRHPT